MQRRNAELRSIHRAYNHCDTACCCHPRLPELCAFLWEFLDQRLADLFIHRLADVFDLLESVPADQNPRISVFASEEREVPELDLKEIYRNIKKRNRLTQR